MSNIGPSKELVAAVVDKAAGYAVQWRKTLLVVGAIGAAVLLARRSRGRRGR